MQRPARWILGSTIGLALGLVPLGPPASHHTTTAHHPGAWLSIPRLGITQAPIWLRGYRLGANGMVRSPSLPAQGVVRLAESVPLGHRGLSVIYGSGATTFRFLWSLQRPHPHERPPFGGDEVQILPHAWDFHPRWRYRVRRILIMAPRPLLRLPRLHGAMLALLTTTLVQGRLREVVVLAQKERYPASLGRRPSRRCARRCPSVFRPSGP